MNVEGKRHTKNVKDKTIKVSEFNKRRYVYGPIFCRPLTA